MSSKYGPTPEERAAAIVLMVALLTFLPIYLAAFPFVAIWAGNTLFGLHVAYTWQTWLSVHVVSFVLRGVFKSSSKS